MTARMRVVSRPHFVMIIYVTTHTRSDSKVIRFIAPRVISKSFNGYSFSFIPPQTFSRETLERVLN